MLENHSFDNIFATSRIPGITAATVEDFNFVEGKKYFVQDGAPWCMTTDPGHEFDDVLEQLCGYDAAQSYQGGAYPTIDNSGFASNYATSTSELTGLPDKSHVVDIMSCFDTRSQLPVIHQLAANSRFATIGSRRFPGRLGQIVSSFTAPPRQGGRTAPSLRTSSHGTRSTVSSTRTAPFLTPCT